mmetsp:Transcript_38361/g.105672  ORF Transcript_38361/g.105672 Transcript_38361/m.105672 type:complete len:359 (-) Transcript_38361:87-1163(-)
MRRLSAVLKCRPLQRLGTQLCGAPPSHSWSSSWRWLPLRRKATEAAASEGNIGGGSGRQVEDHITELQARSRRVFVEDGASRPGLRPGKFQLNWRDGAGHKIPYRFRLQEPPQRRRTKPDEDGGDVSRARAAVGEGEEGTAKVEYPERTKLEYTDFTGLRFPTLETAENFDYNQDVGLKRVVERAFPIKVPGYRRLDPYLREYIHFLHNLDPARFTIARIAERYRLRAATVMKVVQEWGTNRYLTRSGLTRLQYKNRAKPAVILQKKEEYYGRWAGWDQLGDQDDPHTDDETIGDFKGWRSMHDWVRRQTVEVEMMSAFPMMEKRDPMPKRVDVDLIANNTRDHKIINWIDPTDKVVF